MADRIRSFDWRSTSLGAIEDWPTSLLTTVNICLNSKFPFLIWWGRDLTLIYNDAYAPILGSKHPHVLGKPGVEAWGEPEVWNIIKPMLHQVLDGGEATWSEDQLLLLQRKGFLEETYFTWSYSPVHLEDGSVGGVLASVAEVTTRVLGERRLKTLRELGNRTTDLSTIMRAATVTSEVLLENTYDVPFSALYLFEAEDRSRLRLISTSGLIDFNREFPFELRADGCEAWPISEALMTGKQILVNNLSERDCGFSGGPFAEAAERAVIVPVASSEFEVSAGVIVMGLSPRLEYDEAYRDFVELVSNQLANALNTARAYEEMKKRAEKLAELDRAKTAFFSNVSHEFRTPLTLMLAPLEQLLNGKSLETESQRELELVHRNGLRLLRLVNSLLNFSRIEAGREQATYHLTNVSVYVAQLTSIFRSAIESEGLKLEIDCPTLTKSYFVDRDMFEKIVLNLISNAFKFTWNGGISVRVEETSIGAKLIVEDTGIGIPASELPKLFDRFHRVEGAEGRSHEGTGIGLALVQELVKLHGGTIEVTSVLGQGTRFAVLFPAGASHLPRERVMLGEKAITVAQGSAFVEEAKRWTRSNELIEPSRGDLVDDPDSELEGIQESAKILLADDNKDMRDYVAGLLRRHWDVTPVANGEEALAAARAAPFDVVLTDVMMPKLDGFGLLRELRLSQQTSSLPIIMLSARAGEESKVLGLEAGADDYLVKPFTARELLVRVNSMIKLQRLRKASEEKFRELADSMPQLVYEIQADGKITYMNRKWEERLGVSGIDLGWQSSVHPEDIDKTNEAFRRGNFQKSMVSVEYRLRLKDGTYRWYLGRAVPIFNRNNEITKWYGTATDIQEYKDLQGELSTAKFLAEEANRTKSAFLANMSHEIRTPMTAVLGFIEILRDSTLSLHERTDFINRIDRSGRALLRLIDDILDISKIEAGRLAIEEIRFSPLQIVQEVASMLRVQAHAKGIDIVVKLVGSLPETVVSDPARLRQILVNLIGNGVKFTPKGEVRVEIGMDRLESDRGNLRIAVVDSGIGIAPEKQSSLFQPFSQADDSITRRFGGTGLGLVLSKRLAERLGGDLRLTESLEGQGSRFEVSVAVRGLEGVAFIGVTSPFEQREVVSPHSGVSEVALHGVRVLLAEDVADNQVLMRRYLESAGATVEIVDNGSDAIAFASRGNYDIVLMDVQMPILDGLKATRALRSQGYMKPIVALTAHAMKEEHNQSIEAGCNDHLTKPIGKSQLIESIRNTLS